MKQQSRNALSVADFHVPFLNITRLRYVCAVAPNMFSYMCRVSVLPFGCRCALPLGPKRRGGAGGFDVRYPRVWPEPAFESGPRALQCAGPMALSGYSIQSSEELRGGLVGQAGRGYDADGKAGAGARARSRAVKAVGQVRGTCWCWGVAVFGRAGSYLWRGQAGGRAECACARRRPAGGQVG